MTSDLLLLIHFEIILYYNNILHLMNAVKKTLLKLDIYGYPVTLNMRKNTKHKSTAGGIFSLLSITAIIFLF